MVSTEAYAAAALATEPTLALLREAGAIVRFDPDTYAMLWKPKFVNLPTNAQQGIRDCKLELVRLLVPVREGTRPHRPLWHRPGHFLVCTICKAGWADIDPLGEQRHPWCGWLGQTPAMRSVVQTRGQAREAQRRRPVKR